ncbi:MAG: hypothetical protein KKF33_15355 [Alphaproteobacteria bacterium]|nr:hypothetical protein [Alphaproteobacteria bacterium]
MKLSPPEEWQCDLSIFMTTDGPEFRFKDGRASLTEGADAAKNQKAIAAMALQAAEKAKAEADGTKPS